MAKHDITLDMEENREELLAGIAQHWKSMKKGTTSKVLKENSSLWKKIFALSCVVAVLLDPLFFYIPSINEDMKCLIVDQKLKTTALALRSVTDLCYIVDIIFQLYTGHTSRSSKSKKGVSEKAKRIGWPYILLNILAALPFQQVVIFLFFSKMGSSRSLNTWKFFIVLVMLQYVPRVLRIYLPRKKFDREIAIWVKVAFGLFQVILAGHILGAFWYFMAIQRKIDCWRHVCGSENACGNSTFGCADDRNFTNITLLNNLCPTNPPNTTLFDFGIYAKAFQLGMSTKGSTGFTEKVFFCFWWGLRNLSSLGQNLDTSVNASENVIAVATFCFGLILFIVFVNDFTRIRDRLEEERKRKRTGMIERKSLKIQMWLYEHGLPKDMKSLIMENIKLKENKDVFFFSAKKENEDVNLKNIISILPPGLASLVKFRLCLPTLKQVPMLQHLDVRVLKAICEKLRPVIYTENSYVIRKGKPLKMLIVIQGSVGTYTSNTTESVSRTLDKGGFYGEELVTWASRFTSSSPPISTEFVKTVVEVEAFVLMPDDLESVFSKFWWHFQVEITSNQPNSQVLIEKLAASSIGAAWLRRAKIRKLRENQTISG